MPMGLLCWILLLFWAIFGLVYVRWPIAGNLIEFILFVLLTWKVFGPPLRG